MKICKFCGSRHAHLISDAGCEWQYLLITNERQSILNILTKMDKEQALFMLKDITRIIKEWRL